MTVSPTANPAAHLEREAFEPQVRCVGQCEQVQLRRDLHIHRRLALQTPRRRQQAVGPLAAAGMSSGVVEWSRRGGVRSRRPRA